MCDMRRKLTPKYSSLTVCKYAVDGLYVKIGDISLFGELIEYLLDKVPTYLLCNVIDRFVHYSFLENPGRVLGHWEFRKSFVGSI